MSSALEQAAADCAVSVEKIVFGLVCELLYLAKKVKKHFEEEKQAPE